MLGSWLFVALAGCMSCRDDTPPSAVFAYGGDTQIGRRSNAWIRVFGGEQALGSVSPLVAADFAWVNLECVVATTGAPRSDKGEAAPWFYRARPEALAALTAAGIDGVGSANNHAGDYGPEALVEARAILSGAGFATAGSGKDNAEACSPALVRVRDLGVAIFGLDFTDPTGAAAVDRPGTCHFDLADPSAVRTAMEDRFAEAHTRANLVFAAVHWGDNGSTAPLATTRAMARTLVDIGADAILGSSAHALQGMELVDGRPVIYDAGNLYFDGRDPGEGQRAAVFSLHLAPAGVRRVEVVPVALEMAKTVPATGEIAETILKALVERSAALGTTLTVADGRASVDLPAPPRREPPLSLPDARTGGSIPEQKDPPTDCVIHRAPPKRSAEAAVPFDAASLVPEAAKVEPSQVGPLRLLGVSPKELQIEGRANAVVESWWELTEEIPYNGWFITQFEGPHSYAQEHEPCDFGWPARKLRVGDVIHDVFAVHPPSKLDPGEYWLTIGFGPVGAMPTFSPRLGRLTVAAG